MTFERKCFVDPADIVVMHFECKACHAAVAIPVNNPGREMSVQRLNSIITSPCAHCNAESGFKPGTGEYFIMFYSYLQQFAQAMQGKNLMMKLEIKCPEEKAG